MQVRLQKVIAGSGVASRREAELLIRQGRVTVNGTVIYKLGTCVNPQVDHIKVNGDHVGAAEPEVFILLHKPTGYLTTMKDPQGRPTVADLIDKIRLRVFPVGRLDYDAEGLLLLTNNGQVAQACLHPKYHVPKTYLVKVSKVLTEPELEQLRKGVQLDDGLTVPAIVKKSGKAHVNSWIEMTIFEGRTHQVKRMLEALGHRVLRLKRIRFGPVGLGDLLPGGSRFATDAEANALRRILLRPQQQEKRPVQPMKTPGGPVQRRRPAEGRVLGYRVDLPKSKTSSRGTSLERTTRRENAPMEKGRSGMAGHTRRTVQPKRGDRIAKETRIRPEKGKPTQTFGKAPRQPSRGNLDRSKTKRPSYPMGVAPKVVLKAFMEYEEKLREEQAQRIPLQRTPRSKTESLSGTRGMNRKSRLPRNGSGPRPATPKPSSRPNSPPHVSRVRSRKKG